MQDDMEHFGDIGSLDDNVESFLSHDGGDGRDLYGTTELKKESSKGNLHHILCAQHWRVYLNANVVCSNAPFQVSPLLKLVV